MIRYVITILIDAITGCYFGIMLPHKETVGEEIRIGRWICKVICRIGKWHLLKKIY